MTKAEKRAVLASRGWTKVSNYGAGCWTHPSKPGDFYSLAAAYRSGIGGCKLESMRAQAAARGATVEVTVVDEGDVMEGWTSARYSDRDEPSAWFMVLTEECAC